MYRKAMVLAVIVLLGSSQICPLYAQGDVIQQAQTIVNNLNPINQALGPLIDRAVADGNDALAARLQQLQSIIQEALASLDAILDKRISQLDDVAKNRIAQLTDATNSALAQLNALVDGTVNGLDAALAQRIDQLQGAVGNTVASLPLPTEPIITVGPQGITIYKQKGTFTELSLPGIGLLKNGTKPAVTLEHDGKETPLPLRAASMGLIQVRIPNALIPATEGATSFVLSATVRRGNSFFFFPSYAMLSVPLHICGSLPSYTAEATMTASGQRWDRRTVNHPQSQNGRFYKECTGDGSIDRICAQGSDDFSVDPAPYPGCHGGLCVTGPTGGDNYHSELWRGDCFELYCARNQGRGSNSHADGVVVRQRKLVTEPNCGSSSSAALLKYGAITQVQLDTAAAKGPCAEDGVSASPTIRVRVLVKDSTGTVIETKDLMTGVPQNALSGRLRMSVNDHGLIDFQLTASCRWNYDPVLTAPGSPSRQ
jgi:hypothetical protein